MEYILSKKDQLSDALLPLPLFCEFTREELYGIMDSFPFEVKTFQKDELIHMQNEQCLFMDIILEGKVIVQNIDEKGNVLTIETFIKGDLIGVNLLFSSKNVYPMTIIASMDTVIVMLRKELILELCRRSTNFMTTLLTAVSSKTIILTDKINAISRKTIRECILDFLKLEQYKQESNVIKLPLSKKELAERLGVPRSSLGRELIKMKKDGLIEYDPWTITIKK